MRITALKQRLAVVAAGMDDILAKAAAEDNRDLTADETTAFDAFKAEADTLTASIAREQTILDLKSSAAKPLAQVPGGPDTPPAPATVPATVAEKGVRFARAVRYVAAAKNMGLAPQAIAEANGDSGLFANQNIASGGAGGFLVPEDVSGEVIELLRPASVVMSLGPIIMPMPNGNFTMNRIASGTAASYIGEQQAAPATGMTFGQVKLSAKKLAALVPISNDLLRGASLAADMVVRDDVIAALAQRTDLAFIRGSGSEFSPRGLRYIHQGYTAIAATNVISANATVNLANVTVDLGKMELALRRSDLTPRKPGWLMSPRTENYLQNVRDGNGNLVWQAEMMRGMLRGKPYRVTTQIPENLGGGTNETELYLVDFGHVIVGEHMGIEIAMTTEGAYVDASSTLQSAFSRDETVIRAIAQHDMGTRHLAAIAVLTAVTWA